MFTGITRGLFSIVSVEREPALLRYGVRLDAYGEGLELGASVSIDGCCQSVVRWEDGIAYFDAIAETLEKTTLDELEVGAKVSVERSAKVGDEIGGHDVSGHIRGTGRIAARKDAGHEVHVDIAVPQVWRRYLMTKGFVAIDGSSLTVGEIWDEGDESIFRLYLIPETLRLTNLGSKEAGQRVNVELDPRTVTIVDTVERVLAEKGISG